ncbi:MAG: ferredoxin [Actinomycetota bacterium]
MKVIVDEALCEGNARCMEVAPEVFEVGDDEISHVLIEFPREDLREKVEHAVRVCPKTAIRTAEG